MTVGELLDKFKGCPRETPVTLSFIGDDPNTAREAIEAAGYITWYDYELLQFKLNSELMRSAKLAKVLRDIADTSYDKVDRMIANKALAEYEAKRA